MKVGIIYDPIYLRHDTGSHVENSKRLTEVIAHLEQSQLMAQLVSIPASAASVDELAMVHSSDYISSVQSYAQRGGGWLDMDTVMSADSYQVALHAAGGLMAGVDSVMKGEVSSAFALVRPPGHHATAWRSMGFCLFNNIAIAARHALSRYNLERILIVDFDVHHGNGTQETFYSDPSVLYFSAHQYPFYPGTGAIDEMGSGPGKGTTLNVPLPAWCGDGEYLHIFEDILVPLARRFQPQLILVSAGYDTHWADPIGSMQVSVSGFGGMAGILKELAHELCGGRLVFTLEGGYNLSALANSVKATFEVLLESPLSDDPLGTYPTLRQPPSIDSILGAVKKVHGL